MDVLSHAELVEMLDAFLDRHGMKPSRFGRDALGEPQFVSTVRDGRRPNLDTLRKVSDFMRERDERLAIADLDGPAASRRHRLSAGAR